MTDRMKVLAAGLGGAVVGSLAGYLLLTQRGEALRGSLVPQVEDVLARLQELQTQVVHARQVAGQSWQTLQDLTHGEGSASRPS